jgi:hypothetical protein
LCYDAEHGDIDAHISYESPSLLRLVSGLVQLALYLVQPGSNFVKLTRPVRQLASLLVQRALRLIQLATCAVEFSRHPFQLGARLVQLGCSAFQGCLGFSHLTEASTPGVDFAELVCAGDAVALCDLRVFVDQATEPVTCKIRMPVTSAGELVRPSGGLCCR